MDALKKGLIPIMLVLLLIPPVQYETGWIDEPLLKGYYHSKDRPELRYFTWDRWFSGDFQEVTAQKFNENVPLRTFFIRVANQYDYSLFAISHTDGFLRGKKGWLYEEDYIHEYTGRFFIGEKVIDRKLSLLKGVFDSLASYGIPLIFIHESGKAGVYPEFIPDRFRPEIRSQTNYQYFMKRSAEIGLPVLDLQPVLAAMKDSSPLPVFPKYGMHWSHYATHYIADTLSRYIEKASGEPMPRFQPVQTRISMQSEDKDYDIGELLNLLFPLPETPNGYPEVPFEEMADGKMEALVVGDSYYTLLVESYGKKMFSRQDFWYYNNSLYPYQNDTPPRRVDKTELRTKLLSYDLILLMVSDLNLHSCFWNFPEETWQAFHPGTPISQLEKTENSIRIDDDWFRFMVAKSEKIKKPLDEVIRGDAAFTFLTNFHALENKNRMDSIHYLRLNIRNNPEWFSNVIRKAREMNISPDSMMLIDAIHTYEHTKKKP